MDAGTSPAEEKHHLSLNVIGPLAPGRLVSNPAGIDCPGTCEADFETGIHVQLDFPADGANVCFPATNQVDGCSNISNCGVTMDEDREITWRFASCAGVPVPPYSPGPAPGYHRLSVSVSGPAAWQGTVISSPPGIVCPGACEADFAEGTVVSATVVGGGCIPANGVQGCLNASNCSVTIDEDRQISWAFQSCR